MLLTGDDENAARTIAGQLGLGAYQANCLPEDKLAWIGRSQAAGRQVCSPGSPGCRVFGSGCARPSHPVYWQQNRMGRSGP